LIKGKVAKVTEDTPGGDLLVEAEDILSGERVSRKVSLVVLATGIVPVDAPMQIELGKDLQREIGNQGIEYMGVGHEDLDIVNFERVKEELVNYMPGIVINCAAYNAVDKAEENWKRPWESK
jgi:heterodisulfide reductase subunit A-like polyferredoxin